MGFTVIFTPQALEDLKDYGDRLEACPTFAPAFRYLVRSGLVLELWR